MKYIILTVLLCLCIFEKLQAKEYYWRNQNLIKDIEKRDIAPYPKYLFFNIIYNSEKSEMYFDYFLDFKPGWLINYDSVTKRYDLIASMTPNMMNTSASNKLKLAISNDSSIINIYHDKDTIVFERSKEPYTSYISEGNYFLQIRMSGIYVKNFKDTIIVKNGYLISSTSRKIEDQMISNFLSKIYRSEDVNNCVHIFFIAGGKKYEFLINEINDYLISDKMDIYYRIK